MDIPTVPEKRKPRVQTKREREKRLKGWEILLSDLANCKFGKMNGDVYDGVIRDNLEMFENSIFVLTTSPDLKYHPMAYMLICFTFDNDGKVRAIDLDGNTRDYPELNDPAVKKFSEIFDCGTTVEIADSWPGRYRKIADILKAAFGNGVPKVPC